MSFVLLADAEFFGVTTVTVHAACTLSTITCFRCIPERVKLRSVTKTPQHVSGCE